MENTFHIQWHITDVCNLRCRHCYQETYTKKNELPFSKMEKIFSNIADFVKKRKQKLVIDITGGEPFLYKRWKDIVTLVGNSGVVQELGIITNGFFLNKEKLDYLEECEKFTELKISAEGITKENYEFYRGKDTYERFVDSCKLMGRYLSKTEKTLMFTLTRNNVEQVPYLFNFLEDYGFDSFVVERFIPWGSGAKIREDVVSKADWKKTIDLLCERCGENPEAEEIAPYKAFMVKRVSGKKELLLFGAPCIVGIDGLAVMPDGTVFPCRRFPLDIGNLTKSSLADIWEQSDVLKKARDRSLLKGKCKECKIDSCLGCRALAYSLTGDYLEEDPLCIL